MPRLAVNRKDLQDIRVSRKPFMAKVACVKPRQYGGIVAGRPYPGDRLTQSCVNLTSERFTWLRSWVRRRPPEEPR